MKLQKYLDYKLKQIRRLIYDDLTNKIENNLFSEDFLDFYDLKESNESEIKQVIEKNLYIVDGLFIRLERPFSDGISNYIKVMVNNSRDFYGKHYGYVYPEEYRRYEDILIYCLGEDEYGKITDKTKVPKLSSLYRFNSIIDESIEDKYVTIEGLSRCITKLTDIFKEEPKHQEILKRTNKVSLGLIKAIEIKHLMIETGMDLSNPEFHDLIELNLAY